MATAWHQKQKNRGVKLILTWFAARKCWKKYRDGKTKYFHHPNSAAGYESAVAEYHAWLQDGRDSRLYSAEYRHHLDLLDQCLQWYDRFGLPEDEETLQEGIAIVRSRLKGELDSDRVLPDLFECVPGDGGLPVKRFIHVFCIGGVRGPEDAPRPEGFEDRFCTLGWYPTGEWKERLRQLSALESHGKKQPQTVGNQVKRFLDFKERQARAGVITPRTWGTLDERLPFFVEWIKPGTHVSTIDGTVLTGFYEWVLSRPGWGHQRSKGIFNTARQWIRWAWRQDDVELEHLPRNIDSREFVFLTHLDNAGVTRKTRTENLWTPAEFKQTLESVPEDFKLFLLLMLNCGFTNVDVAVLLKSEVRLDDGRIVRQRSKTRRYANPPVVNYKLWPTTLGLLRKHWSEHPTLALANSRGNPLAVSKLTKKGDKTRETLWTGIGRRYSDMKKPKTKKKSKPKLPDKQLKFLRKTGSTRIHGNPEFRALDTIYLGHSWVTVADKHYNAFDGHPYSPLDEAIDWLGTEFSQR